MKNELQKRMLTEVPAPQLKLDKSLSNHTFKGKGGAFLKKKTKETHPRRSPSTATESRQQPRQPCVRM
jgi:hypothetical protein